MAEPSVGAPAVVAVSERDVLLATKLHVPRPQPGFVASLKPARDLFGHPPLSKPVADKPTKIWISLEDGVTPPAQLIGPVGVKRNP